MKHKEGTRLNKFFVAAFVLVVFVGIFNAITLGTRISDKNAEVDALEEQIEMQLRQIEEDEYLLDENNELEYIERIARVKYGYAAPGERAFYVSNGD